MSSRGLLHLISAFSQNSNGNTAMIFCLAVVPFFGILGFATDYGLALADKAKLDGAADAAALAAIRVGQNDIQAGKSRATAMSDGSALALTTFRANAGSIAFGTVPTPSVTWVSGSSGQTLSVTVAYSATMTNTFSKMFGISTTTVSGTSGSTLTMPSYINYYIITDISQSMGVAATANDMTTLYNRVIQYKNYDTQTDANQGIGCVFGCHVQQVTKTGNVTYTQPVSNETLAHSPTYGLPITLRIDSAKSAIQSIISDAQTSNQKSGQNLIKIGAYMMQQDPQNPGSYLQDVSASPPPSNKTGTLQPPTSDLTTLSTQVQTNMDLGANNGGGSGDTGFNNSLDYFVKNVLPAQGDGSSPTSPINYVFLITDGISDVPGGSCKDGHCTGAFNDTNCTPIRAKATVGVIYTTYNPIYNTNSPASGLVQTYKDLVQPWINAVPGNLQACASGSQFYFEASDGPAITTAMQALFAPTSRQARISQ